MEVHNGKKALAALENGPFDLVLMDVQMPEMDGLETTRRIRQRWPKGRQPHIIAMTANAMQGDREICLEAGMDDYISKPISIEALIIALGKAHPQVKEKNTLVEASGEACPSGLTLDANNLLSDVEAEFEKGVSR